MRKDCEVKKFHLSYISYSDKLESAIVRSAEATRWLLKVFEDLAPLWHIVDNLSSEKEILQHSKLIVELYGCFHLSDS